jgi:hypothetical protein
MLKQVRQKIVEKLLNRYRETSAQLISIESILIKKGISPVYFDHFAMIDLPGPHTGIPVLTQLFTLLGFTLEGKGYLPEKQNDFAWLAEIDKNNQLIHHVLPQAVVADFRLAEMPIGISNIISKYSNQASALPLENIQKIIHQLQISQDASLATQLTDIVCDYLSGRDWPLPTKKEFLQVWEFNQLLAWVLVFGRKPNHFTLSIHLLSDFADLEKFHEFVQANLSLPLNTAGGIIKGGKTAGLAQSSTAGMLENILLADGEIALPTAFVEFIWRYAKEPANQAPTRWEDFHTGFMTQHATHVIKSLST